MRIIQSLALNMTKQNVVIARHMMGNHSERIETTRLRLRAGEGVEVDLETDTGAIRKRGKPYPRMK